MALEAPTTESGPLSGASCCHPSPSAWQRYRPFLLSMNTLITATTTVLLVAGFVAHWAFRATTAANVMWAAAALIGGSPIFVLAAKGIVKGDLTAGLMVSVAMIGAVIIGEYSAAALVAFMFLFGEVLENFTMARANNALKELARLVPNQVTLLRDGATLVVPIEQVRPGDTLLVRNGERIPVDGVVTAGQAAVDQAAITGESVPVDKQAGDTVYAGTMNTAGTLQICAQKVGRDTTLGTIVKLVEDAQRSQAPVQRLANKYAQYLVPVTFSIAVATYFLTGELVRSVTVLVVVCPCALVLATPTALVAAIGNAAKRSVVVKSGASLEALGKIDVVAFDKTGTLTLGVPQVAEVVSLDGLQAEEILSYAASAEKFSEHPLGRAIVQEAQARGLVVPDPAEAQVLTGFGVQAKSGNRDVLVGNKALLNTAGVTVAAATEKRFTELQARGLTVIPVAVDSQVVGLLALSDTVRPTAAEAVRALRTAGLARTVMISGDNTATVAAVAGQLGVDEYHAEVLPQQKLDLIRSLQAQGHRVAYVGDGVNDAPALATANVGIAMGPKGTDVAIETAQIVLMTEDMANLPHLLRLARESLRTIRVDVAFSMSMNLLSLTLGMLGIIGPVFGAIMHEFSAVPVLAYSARLVAFRYKGPNGR